MVLSMRFRKDRTLDRIVRSFAESVEEFDFDAAEGWFATARLRARSKKAPAPQVRPLRPGTRGARRPA